MAGLLDSICPGPGTSGGRIGEESGPCRHVVLTDLAEEVRGASTGDQVVAV